MRCTRLVVAVVTTCIVVACGAESPSASGGPRASGIVLRTEEPQPAGTARACPAALIEGMLVRDEESGLALQDAQGLVRQVIWPNGYSARDESARILLLDASGIVVAHEGDRVSIGGGEIDAQGTWLGCGGTTLLAP